MYRRCTDPDADVGGSGRRSYRDHPFRILCPWLTAGSVIYHPEQRILLLDRSSGNHRVLCTFTVRTDCCPEDL